MQTARSASTRVVLAALPLIVAFLAAVPTASGAVVINEVESDGGGVADFVELFNDGAAPVDIGGYVIRDSNDGNTFTVPPGTVIAAGGHYVTDTPFGLGSDDAARLFTSSDLASLIDSYAWTSHAAATYGRCPNGTGPFVTTNSPTRGTANACPVAALAWPGGSAVSTVDGTNVFGSNLSGLAYQPSGTAARGVLWAVRNGPSTLFRLVHDGTNWVPDTANGWSAGKTLRYPDGTGVPDAEGVTVAVGDPNGVYVATERNDTGGAPSRPAVLRYDVSTSDTTLSATDDWNMTADLPGLPANAGLEAITWIPDDVLVAKGFQDTNTLSVYDPAVYPDHGGGLFFVGVEQTGEIVAYALNRLTDGRMPVAFIPSGFPAIMALEFEPESNLLWAVCDDSCNGRTARMDVSQSGPTAGRFVVADTYERPGGMANLNNEGFAIAPRAECAGGLKPVFWSDDSNTALHALRAGTLNCTDLPGGTAPPATTTTTTTPDAPGGTAPPPAPPIAGPLPTDVTRPVLSRVRASRSRVAFVLSEAARVRITIQRRSGRRYRRVKAFTVAAAAGARTVRFKGRVAARKLRRGRLRVILVATDAAGNRSATVRRLVRR